MSLFPLYFAYGLQIFFWLIFFGRIIFFRFHRASEQAPDRLEGVSVLIAARNELPNLKILLPKLLSQNYSLFEIVIIDDRSSDGTGDFLEKIKTENPHFQYVRIDQKPEGLSGKKNALSVGIPKTKYNILLLTDADCVPNSPEWIRGMTQPFADPQTEIVLGYSPYETRQTWLNRLVQFDTLLTAIQYFSAYIWQIPYMGVGRNLAYRKSIFFAQNGFQKHENWASGDDDLLINASSHFRNTRIVWDEKTHCISKPAESYRAWFRQKIRHLSVGTQYKLRDRAWIGTFVLSYALFWFSVLFVLSLHGFLPNVLFFVGTRCFLQVWLVKKWTSVFYPESKKNKQDILIYVVFLDFFYIFYYIFIGLASLFLGKTIKWKN